MKPFTIIELGADSESPMVGTVNNVIKHDLNFEHRVYTAIQDHFDADIVDMDFPDLFKGSPYEDVNVTLDDNNEYITYKLRIMETWVY